jgi:flagellar hook-associated protein 2
MALSSPGLGSGLDVNSLVTQLMTFERAPITLLDKKEASYQAKLSSFGTLKSSLASLQTAAKALSTPDKLSPMKATVADATVLSASAGSTAVAGSYDVEVQSLAQSQKLMMSASGGTGTDGYAATSTVVGTGTITIDFGTYTPAVLPATTPSFTLNPDKLVAKTIAIDASNNTLAGIRDAINAANAGVSASIINDGSANGFHLSLTSSDSGARNAMRISVGGATGDLAQLNYDPSSVVAGATKLAENVAAKDAVIKVDNVTITKQSNTITDAIQGVTLSLSKTMPLGTTTKITLTRDTTNVKTAVEGFVKAYNDTNKAIKDATAFDASTGKAAVLTGDSTVRSIQTQLRNLFSAPVAGAPDGMAMLSDVGITFQKDGTLAIDNAKFGAAIANPAKDLSKLFTSTGNIKGYAWQLDVLTGKILSPVGLLVDRTNNVNQSIKDIGTRRNAMNARLVSVEQRYRDQFAALDKLVSSMTTTSNFLTQQLAHLPSNT